MSIRTQIGVSIGAGFLFSAIASTGNLYSPYGSAYKVSPWAAIKVPAAMIAVGCFGGAWASAEQLRRDRRKEILRENLDIQRQQILAQADMDGLNAAAQVQAAERYYDVFEPYMDVPATPVPDSDPPNTSAVAQLGALSIPPISTVPATTLDQGGLIQRLRAECPLLLKLVKSHPIRAIGVQRTGKTTMVKKLALLRLLLLPGHRVVASTPHYEPENGYPSVFKVVGNNGKRDYPAIEREWSAMAARIENCEQNSITTIWDEFGLMDKVIEEETLVSVLKSSLREAMKHGEQPVFIAHGETQAFLPGSKGLVTVLLASTVRVETIGELIAGADGLDQMKPTGKFRVTWLDGTKEDGQIPAWLTEQFLIEQLRGVQKPLGPSNSEEAKAPSDPEEGEDLWETAKERLTKAWQMPSATPSQPKEPQFIPSDMERTQALVNALKLLMQFGKVDEAKEIKGLIENAPDRAIWVALKALSLGVTAASRDVFGVGASGRSFLAKGKPWYDALEHQFGAIKE
jgi:hypothetical protein